MQLIGCAKQKEQFSPGILIGFVIKKIRGKNNNWSEFWYIIELNQIVMCVLLYLEDFFFVCFNKLKDYCN